MALSEFEKKVVLLLMEGRQPDAIADTLGVSVEAVLEATETYERWAREGGLSQPELPIGSQTKRTPSLWSDPDRIE
jgi:hypothetical protein